MSRNRNAPMLVVAILMAGIAFFITSRVFKAKEGGPVVVKSMVVALARDVEIGKSIQKEDLDMMEVPDGMDESLLYKNPADVVGKVSNRYLAKGSPIRSIDVLSAQDSLASLIPEGYQAMTIPVVMPSSLSNLVQVGSRVNVILTYTTGVGTQFKSIALMENVKVLAVTPGQGNDMQITIAVTPEGAKTLAYALKRGTLNIAVRSLSESDKDQPEKFFSLSELFKDQELDSGKITSESKRPTTEEIEIVRGLNKETYRFINGKAENKNSGDLK